MKPLKYIASIFGVAPIRIHQLIRQKIVRFKIESGFVWVDEKAVSDYFKYNPEIHARWNAKYRMAPKNRNKGGNFCF